MDEQRKKAVIIELFVANRVGVRGPRGEFSSQPEYPRGEF